MDDLSGRELLTCENYCDIDYHVLSPSFNFKDLFFQVAKYPHLEHPYEHWIQGISSQILRFYKVLENIDHRIQSMYHSP